LWDLWVVRIVAVDADLALQGTGTAVPITPSPAVGTGFPVAIGRSMATAAQPRAFCELHLVPVAGLQELQVLLVATVETVVVPVMAPVAHNDVLVLLRDDDVLLGVESQRG